ncbi:MAG: 4-alpha-glucanotransferase, partial [Bryobacteraceae bacterium]
MPEKTALAGDPPSEATLERAAALWGILPEYEDVLGVTHRTPVETKKAILAALGVPVHDDKALSKAIEQRLLEEWERPLPPTLVVLRGAEEFPLCIAAGERDASLNIAIRREDGWREQAEVAAGRLPERARAEIGGRTFLRLAVPLPGDLPLGYHELAVTIIAGKQRRAARCRLIVCPARVYEPEKLDGRRRAAGLAVSLYALRSGRNWGCGDFTDLESLIDWLGSEAGASFVGLNPLHAIANR